MVPPEQPSGRRSFWPRTLSLVSQRSLRIFSLLASRPGPKTLAATCVSICDVMYRTSLFVGPNPDLIPLAGSAEPSVRRCGRVASVDRRFTACRMAI
jgi:hypothetical protein